MSSRNKKKTLKKEHGMTLDREKYFFTPRYTRGEVSKVLGVTKDTLRHYEECGLIKPYENEKNRYKYYSIADLEILNVILFLRSMDVSIHDIPNFIECKDINIYGDFLSEQINKANERINYWNNVKNILAYLKKTLDDYQKKPHNAKVIKNTKFRFLESKFDYNNYDIEKMAPVRLSTDKAAHIIKLKIVDKKWFLSNREDTSHLIVGHLCGDEEIDKNICECKIPLALMITTLEPVDRLSEVISKFYEEYNNKYIFEDNIFIIEHTFLNIFNQEALLRNIYLPILENK